VTCLYRSLDIGGDLFVSFFGHWRSPVSIALWIFYHVLLTVEVFLFLVTKGLPLFGLERKSQQRISMDLRQSLTHFLRWDSIWTIWTLDLAKRLFHETYARLDPAACESNLSLIKRRPIS
jgi:hypothetical protein